LPVFLVITGAGFFEVILNLPVVEFLKVDDLGVRPLP
jgi:hypothetical protein